MNWVHPTAMLLGTWVLAFLQVWFGTVRGWLHVQPDVLPAMVVYAALFGGLPTLTAVAFIAGLGADAWSSGPFGLGVIPMLAVGFFLHHRRELILRESRWAQAAIGAAASVATPLVHLLCLVVLWPLIAQPEPLAAQWPEFRSGLSELPVLGAARLWQLIVMGLGGAVATPVLFGFFQWIDRTCNYQPAPLPGRRGDRVIERGRS